MNESNKYQEYIELLKANKNLILTGAPGTGKTFLAREIAKSFINNKSHYDGNDIPKDFNDIIEKYIFPGLEISSSKEKAKYSINKIENSKVSLQGNNTRPYAIPFKEIEKAYKTKLWEGGQKNGFDSYSTALAKYIYKSIKIKDNYNQIQLIQFHPSYDYTDFVEGLRPTPPDKNGNIGFKREDGVFKAFCKEAIDSNQPYLFIIDEINRGELSKIFGELFFCIDPGYRGKKGLVKTQYQNLITDESDPFYEGFYVPENVYIIGTMNDIDRSVESMDFAMRRRFAWKEVKANENTSMLDELGELKNEVIRKMNRLNTAIWNEETNEGIEGLSAAYHIGGAYFMKLKLYLEGDNKTEAYRKLWENHLRGVLFEYLRGSLNATENLSMLEKTFYSENE